MKSTFNTLGIVALFTATIAGAMTANAESLTPEQALSRAMAQNSTNAPVKVRSLANSRPELVYTQMTENQPTVYIFNNKETKDGYLILSADDIAPAVLGYSDNDSFNLDRINPELNWWLSEYGRQIEWAREKGVSGEQSANLMTNYAAIPPMTTTQWNQNAPFNNDCPEINGQRAVTGCVATALAQVMKYHNWPDVGTGSNSYTNPSTGTTLSVDFANTTYKWDDMINVYDGNATSAQKAAVATLMYSCGVAVNMEYTADESSATSFAAAQAMVNYFKYDKGIMFYNRDYYSISDWNELVYNQLKNYGPVQYSGQSNDGGHSFVCDGYSEDGYFHINWGWGGMSDGYFLLTALNPTVQGIGGSTSGYNFDQDIIGNVKPADGTSSSIIPNFVAQAFQASSSEVSLGNEVEFSGPMYSFSLAGVSGDMGVKLVNNSGDVSYIQGSSFSDMEPEYGTNGFSIVLPSNLQEGTYTISPAVKSSAGSWYDVPIMVGASNTNSMTVADGVATFTTQSASSITINNIDLKTDFYIGANFEITATISNNSDSEYLGGVTLVVINSENQEVAQGEEYPLDIQSGESQNITYLSGLTETSGATLTAGTYSICFVDENGNQLSDMQTITLNAESTPTLSLNNFTIKGGTEVTDKSNMEFTGNLSVTEGYFGNTLTLVIFPDSDTAGSIESVASFTSNPIFLASGQSTDLSIKADFSNGTNGSRYFAMLYNGSNPAVNNRLTFTLTNATDGVNDLMSSPNVFSTEYYTLNGSKVQAQNLTPGLYIVRKTTSDGHIVTEKKIIN